MKKTIDTLIHLQDCDIRIMEIQKEMDQGPARIDECKRDLTLAEDMLQEKTIELDTCKKEKRQIEHDISELETNIEKSNVKLGNIKSNKEYRAIIKELETLNKQKSALEDKLLELLEEIERKEKALNVTARQLEKAKTVFDRNRKTILEETEKLQHEMNDLEKKKADISRDIEPDLLKRYNILRKNRGGVAISAVLNGICQACNITMPPQKFNELIKGADLISCPNCKRILYYTDDSKIKDTGDN